MECVVCHGTFERGRTTYTVNRKGYHLIIDRVPAWICRQCGEVLFDEETIEAIQAMLCEVEKQAESLALATA